MRIHPTQVLHPSRATARTTAQIAIGLAAVMPTLVDDIGLNRTWPIVVVVLGISAGITRIMSIPAVNMVLTNRLGIGAAPAAPAVRSETTD